MVTHLIALGREFDFLPDDTEESLLGAPIHQFAIVILFTCLTRYARRLGLPWFVGNQTTLVIPRADGRPYQPAPDLLLHPTLGRTPETSLHVADDGPPALVIEVASPSTARTHDLDTLRPQAKPGVYACTGIAEYLVFDPTAALIPERVRAWCLGPGGVYVPWEPDERGHWVSWALGISFALRGPMLAAYDADGTLLPGDNDMDAVVEEREREIAALRDEVRRLRGE